MKSHAQQLQDKACTLAQLDSDMKRMLSVQLREFIHHIEDHEPIATIEFAPPACNIAWLSLYDRYKIA